MICESSKFLYGLARGGLFWRHDNHTIKFNDTNIKDNNVDIFEHLLDHFDRGKDIDEFHNAFLERLHDASHKRPDIVVGEFGNHQIMIYGDIDKTWMQHPRTSPPIRN